MIATTGAIVLPSKGGVFPDIFTFPLVYSNP
ncbi:hypothetical protein LMG31506_04569 [Cupriavidus yeoncheonensis]|uniref:Uncharacterized protein n=1 Tax=Cupriavidus yeoncheonensis TaxID=1462994 RepID=A0A916IYW0_9BURK|nr:hypothetical protein LMG31506_04569 [Cupriavidus yeoncheonensis]